MGGHRISPRFCPDLSVLRRVLVSRRDLEAGVKKAEEVMEILEAYDLAGSLRGAAALAGCDHKTVAHWVAFRDREGVISDRSRRRPGARWVRGEDRRVGGSLAREDLCGRRARIG